MVSWCAVRTDETDVRIQCQGALLRATPTYLRFPVARAGACASTQSRFSRVAIMAVGRDALSEAAARGVGMSRTYPEQLKEQSSLSLQHARRRAQDLQKPQSSSLTSHASDVQTREDEHRKRREAHQALSASRSDSFDKPAYADARNERLELVEHLERGPRPFGPRADDPDLQRYEPNAQVVLRSRKIAHRKLQEYLDCRYVITPSLFYSLTGRTGSSRSEYARQSGGTMDGDVEIPLYGDWVLFAVMGEKGPLKYTTASVDDKDEVSSDLTPFERTNPTRPARKYFGCKLLDLNTEVVQSHRQLPGHCVLQMMLFESKTHANQSFTGGSGGAFEKLWKERDGMLLAILNPRIMKPKRNVSFDTLMQKSSNELTITPQSADSVLVVGQAEAYAQCKSIKKDGKRCGTFVIRGKNNEVCDYHLEQAVTGRLRSRMEFASG